MSATETTSIGIQASADLYDGRVTEYAFIRKLIWAYFLLLVIGEGVLRKWVLPSLSDFILLIRDPLVIWIYYLAFAQGLFPTENKYIQRVFLWSVLAVVATLLFNGGHPLSIAYGIHSNLLHFPLIFIIAKVLTGRGRYPFRASFSIACPPHDLAHDTTVSSRTRRHHEHRGRGNWLPVGNIRRKSQSLGDLHFRERTGFLLLLHHGFFDLWLSQQTNLSQMDALFGNKCDFPGHGYSW